MLYLNHVDITVTVMYIRDIHVCDVVLFLTASVVSVLQCVYEQLYKFM